MEERRKNKRIDLGSKLLIKRLDQEEALEVEIDIVNVSKNGIGFECAEPLMIGSVYEGFLTIWTREIIHAFIEIVRIEKLEDTFDYGGIFIGMPEVDSQRIEIYETVEQHRR